MDAGAVLRYENETNIKTDKHKKKPVHRAPIKLSSTSGTL